MKNVFAIGELSSLMGKSCETIGQLSMSMNNSEQSDNETLMETYQGVLLNELENVQHMLLVLTKLVTDQVEAESRQDEGGSVFMAGELNDDLGEKTQPGVAITEKEDK